MALDENISFLKSQIDLYRSTQRSLQLALERSHASYQALNAELRDQHRRIRELREALVQPSSSPSRARIEDIVRLQGKLDRLTSLQQMVDSTTDELWVLAKKWADTKARLKELSGSDFSSEDREKMGDFEASVQRQLELYGFGSFHADEIHLSEDNFRPIVRTRDEGSDEIVEKELGFEVSASDGIRLKWAYYLSLLALSKARTTNHAGLVIFDEPGQHQMETDSFEALLRWASTHLGSQQQAIVATSESLATVRGAIASHMANVINIEGFILKPVE